MVLLRLRVQLGTVVGDYPVKSVNRLLALLHRCLVVTSHSHQVIDTALLHVQPLLIAVPCLLKLLVHLLQLLLRLRRLLGGGRHVVYRHTNRCYGRYDYSPWRALCQQVEGGVCSLCPLNLSSHRKERYLQSKSNSREQFHRPLREHQPVVMSLECDVGCIHRKSV